MGTRNIEQTPESPSIQEIAPHIYQAPIPLADETISELSHVNTYLIEGDNGWILIDCGWDLPGARQALDNVFSSLEISFSNLSKVILTHGHPDHAGQTGRIKQISPSTRIIMHRWEAELLETRYAGMEKFRAQTAEILKKNGITESDMAFFKANPLPARDFANIAPADCCLYGGEIIDCGRYHLEVIWTPGHSPGHICLYEPETQILFSGDHVLPGITTNVSYNAFSGDNPLGDYINALEKLRNLPVQSIHPAHEFSFTNLKTRADELVRHHIERENEIQAQMQNRECNAYEIAARLTWNVKKSWDAFPAMHKQLAVCETLAHMEHMRWGGLLRKIVRGETIRFLAI